ncbi:MAG TPA: type II secretion system F family protein [Noviherbaspirillum sp.]|uniref:type II secretion system F family protein n=1 Tax=Noviherbaspirillum sp. TaxID=1926288 RepID=UPI002B4870A0|nr:type II secretion system F family protein [Noviherbaspirillum sp.]HJV84033.1 type II secretion system F family protein [Noviherbaspirillum sp.]
MEYAYILFVIALFIAVVFLLEGLYMSWNASRGPVAKRIAQRLKLMSEQGRSPENSSILKQRLLSKFPGVQRLLERIPRIDLLDGWLEQSGLNMSVARLCAASLGCFAAVFALLWILKLPVAVAAACGLAAGGIPFAYVTAAKRKRLHAIEEQLPDALDLVSRALRAGHSFSSAIQMVGQELADPLASEFKLVFDEVNYGIPMQDALKHLSARVPGTDVGYFVVAVLIQRETGGNLAELLGKIATLVRERLRLFGQIRVYSAEARLSAWILGLLPIVLVLFLNIVNPRFMRVLWTDPAGEKIITVISVMMVFGAFWMRKIIRIKV